jgi:polyisoprenoid-binding protein YceI
LLDGGVDRVEATERLDLAHPFLARFSLSACLLVLLSIGTGLAQGETFLVNPDQSEVAFSLGDVLHQVHGTFHVQSGSVQFSHNSPELSGSLVVAAGSGKSGNNTRDHRMSVDILEAPRYTEASFSPKRLDGAISASGDSTVRVDGVFTLHGTAHDLTIPMQIHIDGKTCTAKTSLMIPYVKWGLKDPSTFLLRVNKEVAMDITLVGQLSTTPQ